MTALSVTPTTFVTALLASAYSSSEAILVSVCHTFLPVVTSAASTVSAMWPGVVPCSGTLTGRAATASLSFTTGGRGPAVVTNGPRWLFGAPGSPSIGAAHCCLPVSTSTAVLPVGAARDPVAWRTGRNPPVIAPPLL